MRLRRHSLQKKNIYVTLASRPGIIAFSVMLIRILYTKKFTNDGFYLRKLERSLQSLWKVKHVVLMCNGTMPLLFLMQNLGAGKKVLTTPFSFVATTDAIVQTRNLPIFVDIDPEHLQPNCTDIETTLSQQKIDAVLLTQIYGRIPDYLELKRICSEHNIPLYFDSSHSFGVEESGISAYALGDASTASFHSTKIFSTVEGGALVTDSDQLAQAARKWRNFGIHNGEISTPGINAKMSEISAAFGLSLLNKAKKDIKRREKLAKHYKYVLSGLPLEVVSSPNHSYFPIIFPTEERLLKAILSLESVRIYPRRYFYPSLDALNVELGFFPQVCPQSRGIANRILCLPMGGDVKMRHVRKIGVVLEELLS